jgi:hypothetical protein
MLIFSVIVFSYMCKKCGKVNGKIFADPHSTVYFSITK